MDKKDGSVKTLPSHPKGEEDAENQKLQCVRLQVSEETAVIVVALAICKVKHLTNREVFLPNIDASREFVLKCIEEVCGNCIYHEEGVRKSFNI